MSAEQGASGGSTPLCSASALGGGVGSVGFGGSADGAAAGGVVADEESAVAQAARTRVRGAAYESHSRPLLVRTSAIFFPSERRSMYGSAPLVSAS